MTAFELSYKSSTPVLLAALAACGGGDGGGSGGNSGGGGGGSGAVTPVATYAISGEVSGLAAGKTVLLRNNGVDELSVAQSGSFKFGSRVETGKAYAVTVVTQPQGQTCQVQAGSGTATGDVSNIKVTCADTPVAGGTGSTACLDGPQLRKQGNRWTMYRSSSTETQLVLAPATFNGHANADHTQTSNGSMVTDLYSNVISGVAHTWGGFSQGLAYEFRYQPSMAMPLDLPLNQTYSQTYQSVTIQGGTSTTASITQTATYRGRESITTAFGTFDTCRIDFTSTGVGSPGIVSWSNWYFSDAKYSGLVAQQSSAQDGTHQPRKIDVSWN